MPTEGGWNSPLQRGIAPVPLDGNGTTFTQRTQLFFPGSQLLSSRFQKSFPLFQTLQLRQFLPERSLLSLSIAGVLHSLCLPRCPFLHLIEYGIPLFFQVFQ